VIATDDFHRAADAIPHDEDAAMQQLGCEPGAIKRFVSEAVFRNPETEAAEATDPLALILGISIGIQAARADALREKEAA
jgi:hypothetical protein